MAKAGRRWASSPRPASFPTPVSSSYLRSWPEEFLPEVFPARLLLLDLRELRQELLLPLGQLRRHVDDDPHDLVAATPAVDGRHAQPAHPQQRPARRPLGNLEQALAL